MDSEALLSAHLETLTELREAGRAISAKTRAAIEQMRDHARSLEYHPTAAKIIELADGLLAEPADVQERTFVEREGVQIIEAVKDKAGREWDVVLIESGLSKNGNYYPAEALQKAVPLFEGAYAFADHATDAERRARPERSVRDKVGRFTDVAFGRHQVGNRVVEGLKARFKVVQPWLREVLLEAVDAGEPDFVGFSIDAEGKVARRNHQGRMVQWVENILRVNSVDVVTDPAAGGRIQRLVASNRGDVEAAMEPEELARLIAEQVKAAVAEATEGVKASVMEAVKPAADDGVTEQIREALAKVRVSEGKARLSEALSGKKLTDVSKGNVRRQFMTLLEAGKDFTDEEVETAIKEAMDQEAIIAQQFANPRTFGKVEAGESQNDIFVKRLERIFDGPQVVHDDGVQAFGSLKEAYCRWTGTNPFDVDPHEIMAAFSTSYDSARDHKRVQESLSTADWGQVFADTMYTRLIREYRAAPYNTWRQVVSDIENVPDFRTRHMLRIGGYADLPTVPEKTTYPVLDSPTDEEITYSITKHGGIDDVTFESIVSDRVGAVRRIPSGMARAALRTLNNFVFNLITTDNPTLDYDSTALYHANHGNTGTTAMSLSGLATAVGAFRDQTAYNESAEILGNRNRVKFLIVPNELEFRARRIVGPSDSYVANVTDDTGTVLDPQAFKGSGIEVIVDDTLTDANDWYMVADPAEVPTVVVGFLNGAQEPELFVQDDPRVGSNFTSDKVSYKVRHIYGGDVIDHRSFRREVVA